VLTASVSSVECSSCFETVVVDFAAALEFALMLAIADTEAVAADADADAATVIVDVRAGLVDALAVFSG
jgi:hypothetical protein